MGGDWVPRLGPLRGLASLLRLEGIERALSFRLFCHLRTASRCKPFPGAAASILAFPASRSARAAFLLFIVHPACSAVLWLGLLKQGWLKLAGVSLFVSSFGFIHLPALSCEVIVGCVNALGWDVLVMSPLDASIMDEGPCPVMVVL